MRKAALLALLLGLLALSARARTHEDVDGFHPACGAPGDVIYVQARALAASPQITLGGRPVPIVRRRGTALLCRAPEGLAPGRVQMTIDGMVLPEPFRVVSPESPVLDAVSAPIATPGQWIRVRGRRLRDARYELRSANGEALAIPEQAALDGFAGLRLPEDVPAGHYRLAAVRDGVDLAAAAPALSLEIREQTRPGLIAILTRPATPGRRICCLGAALAPVGACEVTWSDEAGVEVARDVGLSNGYDRLRVAVPASLAPGRSYRLSLGRTPTPEAPSVPVYVVAAQPPRSLYVDAVRVAAGGSVALAGDGLSEVGPQAVVALELDGDAASRRVPVLYRHPGGLGHGAAWILGVPAAVPPGTYPLRLHLADRALDAGTLAVTTGGASP